MRCVRAGELFKVRSGMERAGRLMAIGGGRHQSLLEARQDIHLNPVAT